MIIKREATSRGKVSWKWLKGHHSFSFGSYIDPKWMGFSKLRVLNEDYIDPNKGFETHPHRNMEILTFIIEGSLEHKDTIGNKEVTGVGEIQLMSAGSGIEHSEFNPSSKQKTHALQVWIYPKTKETSPRYQKYKYPDKVNELVLLASNVDKDVAHINQDTQIYLGKYERSVELDLDVGHQYWIQVFRGKAEFSGVEVQAGDGVGISLEGKIELNIPEAVEFLLFKLP